MPTAKQAALVSLAATLLAPLAARASDEAATPEGAPLRTPSGTLAYQPAAEPAAEPAEGVFDVKDARALPFGAEGTAWWTVTGAFAYDFEDATDADLRVGWSRFISEGLELSLELAGWYYNQPGDDQLGINPAFGFRWHFARSERSSYFVDIGIGLLFTTGNVPEGGTSFNFTPRAGLGLTHRISEDSPSRFILGARWHHISNARVNGDARNPSRDGVALYAGLMFPY